MVDDAFRASVKRGHTMIRLGRWSGLEFQPVQHSSMRTCVPLLPIGSQCLVRGLSFLFTSFHHSRLFITWCPRLGWLLWGLWEGRVDEIHCRWVGFNIELLQYVIDPPSPLFQTFTELRMISCRVWDSCGTITQGANVFDSIQRYLDLVYVCGWLLPLVPVWLLFLGVSSIGFNNGGLVGADVMVCSVVCRWWVWMCEMWMEGKLRRIYEPFFNYSPCNPFECSAYFLLENVCTCRDGLVFSIVFCFLFLGQLFCLCACFRVFVGLCACWSIHASADCSNVEGRSVSRVLLTVQM